MHAHQLATRESFVRHEPSPLSIACWMVYVPGGEPVGPVSADQIARGIRAGRVPADASVQRCGDVWWSGVLDEGDMIAALRAASDAS